MHQESIIGNQRAGLERSDSSPATTLTTSINGTVNNNCSNSNCVNSNSNTSSNVIINCSCNSQTNHNLATATIGTKKLSQVIDGLDLLPALSKIDTGTNNDNNNGGDNNCEINVHDIIGSWGRYQTSLSAFLLIYVCQMAMIIVCGPVFAPTLTQFSCNSHTTATTTEGNTLASINDNNHHYIHTEQLAITNLTDASVAGVNASDISDTERRQCYASDSSSNNNNNERLERCTSWTYLEPLEYGINLSNQSGFVNTLGTIIVETTGPSYRYASMLAWGTGWSFSGVVGPLLELWLADYRLVFAFCLGWQLLMLPWCWFGLRESIRWLLAQDDTNGAQVELQRACAFNGRPICSQTANQIAIVQQQHLRKVSSQIDVQLTSESNSNGNGDGNGTNCTDCTVIKPLGTLLGTFTDANGNHLVPTTTSTNGNLHHQQQQPQSNTTTTVEDERPHPDEVSLDQQRAQVLQLLRLATLARQQQLKQETQLGIARMFHKQLRTTTVMLCLVSMVSESYYYGLLAANAFVGTSVVFNYMSGTVMELLSVAQYFVTLSLMTRRLALASQLLVASLCVLAMALTYQFMSGNLRETINLVLLSLAKITSSTVLETLITIALESYPTNLRQTGSGFCLAVGRVTAMLAPFMFQFDIKLALAALGIAGLVIGSVAPLALRETKNQPLVDHLQDLEEQQQGQHQRQCCQISGLNNNY
ncbi:Solute carrier family 22 member 15-like protein [Fragariocoptes setiger]|uniref:Solute carrier family 22 member 15-like protein n=1 Tax=Fragariocoptes setiger TaxID=1670756 RepID=A0ABQ7S7H1_9ACAR|nr:Solute carrier family 22 member 15-like protein [Fragariocoptes setiger]